ncbi:MAG: Competence protein ComM [Candidatus Latescibacteria bacterium ADurb.Bin168]|nr:MAG: Competence protein ComM [Candidatus Latescibacteria bacterium ADurb.Bin168]
MLTHVFSAATHGVDAYIVDVEANLDSQVPSFTIVGLPEGAVKESRDRVIAAVKNTGLYFPLRRITINLAPADIRKEGSAFDLPMAVGILAASEQAVSENLPHTVLVGELSLDGSLRSVPGVLSMAVTAKREGKRMMIVPSDNVQEAALVEGLEVYAAKNLDEALDILANPAGHVPHALNLADVFARHVDDTVDMFDVKGQQHVKRALEVAAAGGHNVIMIGPPGSGKTMLARCMPTILPDMTLDEALSVTKIHSVAGQMEPGQALIATRPFRSPHHTISDAGLIGGGTYPKPGEVSLAHHGVLFLDELPEFKRTVLEVLRQPLEDGRVTISRAATSLDYPAEFLLVASCNPCPCGFFGDASGKCTCTPQMIERYMSKLSGPLLDRIDIHVNVPAVPYKELAADPTGERSAAIRERVNRARDIQAQRFREREGLFCNARMVSRDLRTYCRIDDQSHELLRMAIQKMGLSARAHDRILKVARTIADLDGSAQVTARHVAEAVQYRSLDRQLWLR